MGTFGQLCDSRREQRLPSAGISALVVMERRRDLNQPLQERFLRFRRSEPQLLPHFVSFEEPARVEVTDAGLEFLGVVHRAYQASGKSGRSKQRPLILRGTC